MAYLSYIVTIVAIVLAGIFAILVKVWAGFAYFVLAIFLLLSLFWAGWLMFKFFTSFKKEMTEKYSLFRAQKANELQLGAENLEENEQLIQNSFKKLVRKEKIYRWLIIALCLAIAVAFLLSIIWY